MSRKYSSISVDTTLSSQLTAAATTATVASATNLLGGITLGAGETFTVALAPDTANEEVVVITAVAGNSLTITRAQGGTSAKLHESGTTVRHVLTSIELTEFATKTGTETLTNKTVALGSNTISGTTAQFNTALSDGDFATLAGTETLTNKTLTNPAISNIDAAGDLLYGTANNTIGKLAIGTAGQVLKVNSGATAPEWGVAPVSQTLLSSGNLASGTTSITGISGSYNDLKLIIRNFDPATDAANYRIQFNTDTGSSYYSKDDSGDSGGVQTSVVIISSTDDTDNIGMAVIDIPNYANTVSGKIFNGYSITKHPTSNIRKILQITGIWESTSAITSIELSTSSGNVNGGDYLLYGIK